MTTFRTLFGSFTDEQNCFDASKFMEAVLLFDTVLAHSPVLPGLIRSVGTRGLLRLLDEERFVVVGGGPSAQATCDFKSPGFFSGRFLDRPLRFGFETIYTDPNRPGNRSVEERLAGDLRKAREIAGIGGAQLRTLHDRILATMRVVDVTALDTTDDFREDLRTKHAFIADLLMESIVRDLGVPIYALNATISVEEVADHIFQIDTNLGKLCNMNGDIIHECLKKRFFQITGANLQLRRMQAMQAVAGLHRVAAEITRKRLDFLARMHTEADTRPTLARIMEIADVPSLRPDSLIDVDELVRLRDSARGRSFRDWLQGAQNIPDEELQRMVTDWKSKLGEAFKSDGGQIVRWLASTGAGALPIIGAVASSIDFFLNKFLPEMGPIGFIERDYRRYVNEQSHGQAGKDDRSGD